MMTACGASISASQAEPRKLRLPQRWQRKGVRGAFFGSLRLPGFFTKGCGHVSILFSGNLVVRQFGDGAGIACAAGGAGGRLGGQRADVLCKLSNVLLQ
jgi:hypothetical protein